MNEPPDPAHCEELEPLLQPAQRVEFVAHLAGAFVDAILFVLVMVVLAALVAMIALNFTPQQATLPLTLVEIIRWIMVLLYAASEVLFATSPGKWMTRIMTRRADGMPASRRQLLVRSAIKCSPLLVMGVSAAMEDLAQLPTWGASSPMRSLLFATARHTFMLANALAWGVMLGGLLALLPSRRALHDWIAGTAVFHNREIKSASQIVQRGFEVQAPTDRPLT
jgi:uncharacterized RDD family membrane protein YckC